MPGPESPRFLAFVLAHDNINMISILIEVIQLLSGKRHNNVAAVEVVEGNVEGGL